MLSPEQKKAYQKEYMRKKRSNTTQLDPSEKAVRPAQNVRPLLDPNDQMLDPRVLDPVRPTECDNCPKEYARGYQDGLKAGKVIKTPQDALSAVSDLVKRPIYDRPLHHPTCACGVCKSGAQA